MSAEPDARTLTHRAPWSIAGFESWFCGQRAGCGTLGKSFYLCLVSPSEGRKINRTELRILVCLRPCCEERFEPSYVVWSWACGIPWTLGGCRLSLHTTLHLNEAPAGMATVSETLV